MGVGHMMGDRRSLAHGAVFGGGVEPEWKGGHFKAIPSLGEVSNTPKKLTISVADAVDAMDLGGLSRIEKTDGNVASPISVGGNLDTLG